MTETIVVFLIAGVALALSARWIYRTVAGKADGCGCQETSCPSAASCDTTEEANYTRES